jgi:hypothetical protein
MSVADWMIIVAVILGPILAIQVQKVIEKWKEKRDRQNVIFKTLMTTRGTPVSPLHVEALNTIDLEFDTNKTKEKAVVDSWKIYRDHLNDAPQGYQDPNYKIQMNAWTLKSTEHLTDLLFSMAQSLNYDFDKVLLKKGAYTPQGFADLERDQWLLRRGIIDLLIGDRSLPIQIKEEVR